MNRADKALASTDTALEAEQIESWLADHPDFFLGREQLLCNMQLEHACGDSESLLLYQLQLLRQNLKDQQQRYQQLLNNARDNEKRLKRVERLLVKLVEANNTEELVSLLQEQLQQDFDIPRIQLWSYTNLSSLPRASEQQQQQQLDLLGQHQARSLTLEPGVTSLLGLDGMTSGSAILCRLSHTRTLGLLVLAHPSVQHFRQQDTLFVEHLCAVISRLLSRDRLGFRPD
ncbi:DUF484 family protein [Marinospirillum alkaliphilum]|uniref:DUF484 domain-containing protein n=1 Tax=Marinospirillum alkaliphilum DSM 21637 TaxID=1122209 RepID=A0A1K1Y482_9GAMM|nr:DUF484 family protein [Marinospirillum alkaliphilum]SFX56664.1 hypothetical protein SAMN02745752_02113 [Marinospirillum alkaliphilum DSM 21637]